MRSAGARVLFGFSLLACGGNDFEAAYGAADAGSIRGDSHMPQSDGSPLADKGREVPDAADEPAADAAIERAVEGAMWHDAGSPDRAADVAADRAPSDGTVDATIDSRLDTASERVSDAIAGATCDAPVVFYLDRDGDQFGVTAERLSACVAPLDDAGTWVTQPGDCRDDLTNVKPLKAGSPDPPMYSGVGYSDPVRPQGISFDFDCDGFETADPSNSYGVEATCGALSTNCGQIGYVQAGPGRGGPGIHGYCGSTTVKSCMAQGLNCNPIFIQVAAPFRCR
jgi:hypothetical protein